VPLGAALVALPIMLVLNVPAWAAATLIGLLVLLIGELSQHEVSATNVTGQEAIYGSSCAEVRHFANCMTSTLVRRHPDSTAAHQKALRLIASTCGRPTRHHN
jgi:hypothetical protein